MSMYGDQFTHEDLVGNTKENVSVEMMTLRTLEKTNTYLLFVMLAQFVQVGTLLF